MYTVIPCWENDLAHKLYMWKFTFLCVCVQEWPLLSWCCWPVWTRAPTRGSTQLSPAACPQSCRICCSVGRDLAAGAPYPTTPPPHTPPPTRTACTDRDWWDGNRHTVTCLKRHAWLHTRPVARTWCCTHPRHHYRLYLQHCRTADLYQMFPTTKDGCTVNRTLSLITYPLHPRSEEGCHWRCQHHFMRVAFMDSIYNEKWPWNERYFHLSCSWAGPVYIWEKVLPCSDRAEPQECKGVDHCINSLMARLMYKAADKAMGVEKRKQQAEGNGNRDTNRQEWAKVLLDWELTWGWHGCYSCWSGPEKTVVEI